MRKKYLFWMLLLAYFAVAVIYSGCAPPRPEPVKIKPVTKASYEPSTWGKSYPLQYQSALQTKEPKPTGLSKYKKGWDTDKIVYDKLSEFPYMALLFNGFGFGVEYNEPRGHYYMMNDQLEVDPARLKAGGVCLTCKSPYADKLAKEKGKEFFKMPYLDAVKLIPKEHKELGQACIDCHDSKTMELKFSRWTIEQGLKDLKKSTFTRQEKRSLACAQCHVTYIVTKDAEMKSTNVIFPWKGSKWGDISIENIIKEINRDPSHLEWTQAVTGFKLGFIRHPEFEFYSRDSVHWNFGVSCSDCHMPYKQVGVSKITDHNTMSPLKNEMKACLPCHPQSAEKLKKQVQAIQERTMSMMLRAGYQAATTAKLFEFIHQEQAKGTLLDQSLYNKAKDYYLEAFYRVVFLGAENSMGFHNPSEAGRIATDAVAYGAKSEALLRQMLMKNGIYVEVEPNLGLSTYLNNRGEKKLNFKPEQEFKDPFGLEEIFMPQRAKGL